MHVGTQVGARDDTDFEVWTQLGLKNVCADPPANPHDWTLQYLKDHREKVESFGLSLDMVQLPLSSRPVEENQSQAIMLAQNPDRDRQIESIQNIIQMVAEAGIPAVKYNMNLIGIPRTERTEGRGGSSNSTWRYAEADPDQAHTIAGEVSSDEFWERIDYFLERVVPVAAQNKVRLACHPHDPSTPDGFMGVNRVLGTVEGLKKFVSLHENEYHGLNFCQGTVSEMLESPGEEIYDVIRYFGSREKIFNVHFRNIRGRVGDFVEVFPDEGDVDMLKAIRAYKEVGYKYMLMPDHVPDISGPNGSGVAFAFCYGYIAALLQAVNEEN